ncbi:MFS transporter [Brevibacillus ginsengisoli]|uniref:MFS transporter n=1 Tax=Brevibacillus ginsengisoli TaxID=363854 RepID=UPI003CEBABBE
MQQQEKLWTKEFILLTLSNFLLFLNLQMVISPLPAYVKSTFQADNTIISLVISLFALAAVLARIVTGEWLKRGNKAVILLIGLAISALSTAGAFWATSVTMLIGCRVLYGVGFGIASTTFPTMVSDRIPNQRMGEGMGYYGFSTSLALSLGPILGLTLLDQFGFGSLIFSSSLAVVLILPLLLLVNLPSLGNRTKPQENLRKQPTTRSDWFNKKLLLPSFLNFLLSVTYGGLLSFLALFGMETHIPNVGWFFLCNAMAIVLIRPISGKVFDRKGPAAVLIPGAVFVIIGLVLLSNSRNTSLMLTSALFYGLGYGILQPSIQAWMIKRVSAEQRGMANGTFLNSIDLGIAIGSTLLGMVATRTGYAGMYEMSSFFMVLFVVMYGVILIKQARIASNREGIELSD